MSNDLISRQAAIDAIRAFYDEYIVYDNGKSIEDLISDLPSAQQEIIRCKDCKYWNGEGKYCDYEMSGLREDFCSWAERKES